MKKIYIWVFALLHLQLATAQVADTQKVFRIGIFGNLFLDSSFTNGKYKFGNQMPRHLLPGLDFVEGALMAFDSLMVDERIQVHVFDVKSNAQSITQLKANRTFDSLHLLIGAVSGVEYRQLADVAFQKNIPFVSATFPNDGGVTNNPFTIIVNSTLPVHCDGIYRYLLQRHAASNIVYLRKKQTADDRVATYFNASNRAAAGGQLLKWKMLEISDSLQSNQLLPLLDSLTTNVILCGSLDERFGLNLIRTASKLPKAYKTELMGMPTWETMKDIGQPEWKELDIFYSTTFFNNAGLFATGFNKTFMDRTNGRPSDLAYRGFETAWYFTNLLLKHQQKLRDNLNDKTFSVFTDFDFRPVFNRISGKADYYENKRIYILKRSKGTISRMK